MGKRDEHCPSQVLKANVTKEVSLIANSNMYMILAPVSPIIPV